MVVTANLADLADLANATDATDAADAADEETTMTEAIHLISQFRAHLAAHFIEYSPLLIALLLWLVSRAPEAGKVVRSDGERLQAVCTKGVCNERAGSH